MTGTPDQPSFFLGGTPFPQKPMCWRWSDYETSSSELVGKQPQNRGPAMGQDSASQSPIYEKWGFQSHRANYSSRKHPSHETMLVLKPIVLRYPSILGNFHVSIYANFHSVNLNPDQSAVVKVNFLSDRWSHFLGVKTSCWIFASNNDIQ